MVHRYSKNKLPGSVFKSLHETFDRRFRGSPQLFQTFCDSAPKQGKTAISHTLSNSLLIDYPIFRRNIFETTISITK